MTNLEAWVKEKISTGHPKLEQSYSRDMDLDGDDTAVWIALKGILGQSFPDGTETGKRACFRHQLLIPLLLVKSIHASFEKGKHRRQVIIRIGNEQPCFKCRTKG